MPFVKLFPRKFVPIIVLPGELKYACFNIPLLLLKRFYDNLEDYNPFNFFKFQSIIPFCNMYFFIVLVKVTTWDKPLESAS